MISITQEQIKVLEDHMENVRQLIESEIELDDFLEMVDDLIVNNILGNNDEPDDTGILLQRIYDQLCNQNYSKS